MADENYKEKSAANPKKHLRSGRLAPSIDRLPITASIDDSSPVSIVNLSETGVALSGYEKCKPGDKIKLNISVSDSKSIYDGHGEIRWTQKTIEGTTVLGVSFISNLLDRGVVDALDSLSLIGSEIIKKKHLHENLPQEFRLFICDYKNFLDNLKASLDSLEEKLQVESLETKESFQYAFETVFLNSFTAEINNYNKQLDQIAKSLQDKKTRKLAIELFQKEIGPLIVPAPFTYRAYKKPLGHAGDYEMMNQIYRNKSEGRTLFEKVIHKAGVNETSSLAVRFRRGFLKDKIKDLLKKNTPVKIASIACGPAKEIVDLVSEITESESKNLTIVLVDQEPEALLNAKREILSECLEHQRSLNIEFANQDIRDIIMGNSPEAMLDGDFDLIYSAGLFDYLMEAPAKLLTMNLLELTKKGGRILIGNFHPSNPTKTISEFSVNWRLFHRTEEQMLQLAPDNIVSSKSLIFDQNKIEIFLEAIK